MAGLVALLNPSVSVDPGGVATASVRIQNTSDIVEQFSVGILGDPAPWTTVEPPVLTVYPGNEGMIILHFRPPRTADIQAGPVPFGVRVTAKEDSAFSQVEEGVVHVGGFAQLEARIVPRTSRGTRGAKHRVELDNHGNSSLHVTLDPIDPDEILVFDCEPWELDVPGGTHAVAEVKVRSTKSAGRAPARRGFQVRVESGTGVPTVLDAALEQRRRSMLPVFLVVLAAVAALAYFLTRPAGELGLRAAYFSNPEMAGEPQFRETISDAGGALDRDYARRAPPGLSTADNWSARFTGQIRFPETGQYQLIVRADDGARVMVDGNVLVDEYGSKAGDKAPASVTVDTADRWHEIEIHFVERDGTAAIRLDWIPPGGERERVPGEHLRASAAEGD